jgi:hypothetical protein
MSGILLALILLAGLIVTGVGIWRCYRLFTMLRRPKAAPAPRWYTGPPTFSPGQVTFTLPPRPANVGMAPSQVAVQPQLPPAQAAPVEETQKLRAVKKETPPPPPKKGWSPGKPYKDLFPPPDPDEAAELEADTALLLSMPTPRHVLLKKPPVVSSEVAPAEDHTAEPPAEAAPSEPAKADEPPPEERPDSVPM